METFGASFWLGLVIGAALGLLFQLLARPLVRLLDRRLESRIEQSSAELRQANQTDKQSVRDYLVTQLLEIALIGAVAGVASGLFFGAASIVVNLTRPNPTVIATLTGAGQVISIIGAFMILRVANTAISTARLIARGQVRAPG